MSTLADKIAAVSGTTKTLAINMKNISSLSSSDASEIESVLEEELKAHGMRIAASARTGVEVNVTLSEGVESLVWVAELGNGEARKTLIVAAPRLAGEGGAGRGGAVILQDSKVWSQADKFLDFILLPADKSGTPLRAVILEADRLAFYESEGNRWDYDGKIAIPRAKARSRDVRGYIDTKNGNAFISGGECSGDLNFPDGVICAADASSSGIRPESRIQVRGREDVEATKIALDCGSGDLALATGPGDWTQADWIQAYGGISGQEAGSAAPTQTEGPVMSLVWAGEPGKVRAVVHNLKTGNYEGYIVTTTCSH